MALPSVEIFRSNGNIVTTPTDQDGVSGFLYYTSGPETATLATLYSQADDANYTTSGSLLDYHIGEYFRFSDYPLYLSIVNSSPSTFSEVETLKNYASSQIRQCAVLNYESNFSSSHITALQTIANQVEEEQAPIQFIYTANYGTSGVAQFMDVTTLASEAVSYVISEDLSGEAASIRESTGKFVSNIGQLLGVVSLSQVQQDPGAVALFNLVGDANTENGFITGENITALSKTLLNSLDDKGYIFYTTYVGYPGVYFNGGSTCTSSSLSDFYLIEFNRVYNKAERDLRTAYTGQLNSNFYLQSNGTLSPASLQYYTQIGQQVLNAMIVNGNISSGTVTMDPTQKPLSNRTLYLVAEMVPIGVANTISVTLGFTA